MTSTSPSLRAADARLLFPHAIHRVQLTGDMGEWRAALEALGITVTGDEPDLVVARGAADAIAAAAPQVLVLGSARRALRRAGYTTRTMLVRDGARGPRLFVPVEFPAASAHALTAPIVGRSGMKRLAIRLVVATARAGVPLPGVVTIGARVAGPPRMIAATGTIASEWYLFTGEGDDRQRLVWFCFDGDRVPSHVVKCGRIPGDHDAFDRDETVLRLLDALPEPLRRHAPQLTARADVDGLPASVETAAPGQPLHQRLTLGHVESIASWISAVGEATALPPRPLHDSLPAVAPVLQHNDLGCWNVIVTDDSFVVVDWESGRRDGLPLWDLVYFLTDALSSLAAPGDERAKEAAMLALLRGELGTSPLLFERLRAAAHTAGVTHEAVGRIVTLCWQHHAHSAGRRDADAGPLTRVAGPWMDDPRLGIEWPAFTTS